MASNLFDLSGRVAVVTGAASGLGQAMAVGLAQHGADIVGGDINDDGLQETAGKISDLGRKAVIVHCDISSEADVQQLFERTDAEFGRVDILVNDPFTMVRKKPEDFTLDEWQKVMDVNLTGYFMCTQAAGKRMIASGKGGSIISISSIGGSLALGRGNFAYSVTKGAINQMTRELAVEWARHGIRVNALQPCQMLTPSVLAWLEDPASRDDPLVARLLSGIPMNRFGEPEDMVGPVVFLASDAAAMVTGTLLPVDGGNLALNAGGSHDL